MFMLLNEWNEIVKRFFHTRGREMETHQKNCLHFTFGFQEETFSWSTLKNELFEPRIQFTNLLDVKIGLMEINYIPREEVHMSWRTRSFEMFQEVFLTKFTVKLITFSILDDVATNKNISST